MYYLTWISRLPGEKELYSLFETHTESRIALDEDSLKFFIAEYGAEIKNAILDRGEIYIKDWLSSQYITKGKLVNTKNSILLTKINEDLFEILISPGIVKYANAKQLKHYIKSNKLKNCTNLRGINGKTEYKSVGTYTTTTDKKFNDQIDKKYQTFILKTLVIGCNMSFKYIIRDHEVKLIRYTGNSKRVIIPDFITTICSNAFIPSSSMHTDSDDSIDDKVYELTLSEGLKFIGNRAFQDNNIKKVIIPSSVKHLYKSTFAGNHELCNIHGTFFKDKIILLNSNTKIL